MGLAAIGLLLVAASPDAGLPPAVFAERAQLLLPGGGWVESECFPGADGGTDCSGGWLPLPRLEAHGGELAQLRTENAKLLEHVPLFSPGVWALIALFAAAGVLVGGIAGWGLRGL